MIEFGSDVIKVASCKRQRYDRFFWFPKTESISENGGKSTAGELVYVNG